MAEVQCSVREYLSADEEQSTQKEDYALGSSVLLTPDSTPTKDTVSVGNKKHKLPVSKLRDDQVVPCVEEKSKADELSSQLDSPKPTQSKLTKADPKEKKPQGVAGGGKGRKGRSKKSSSKSKTAEKASTSGQPSQSSFACSRSVSTQSSEPRTTLVTDYFPVRRSARVPSKDLKKQQQSDIEEKILSGCEDGLEVQDIVGKGRGVVSTKEFKRGDFVVEYIGDTIDLSTAKRREQSYQDNPDYGCYMYYFTFRNKRYCVDATAETDKLGRLLNHSKANGNCMTRVVGINSKPHLILVAMRDIDIGEELLYDYGDRSKSSLEAHPWLAL